MAPEQDDADDRPAGDLDLQRPAPARPPALRAARSVADAKVGEVLMLGRGGEVLGPRRTAAAKLVSWTILGGTVAAVCVTYAQLFSPLAGVVAGAATAAFFGFRLRPWFRYRKAVAMISILRWEEAYAMLLRLEGARVSAPFKAQVQMTLAALDALLGRPQATLGRLDALGPRLRRWQGGYSRLNRWRADLLRSSALARLGRLPEARAQRDAVGAEVAAWEARTRRARGEYIEMGLQAADLELAFAAGSAAELPGDETLHQWARAALLRSQFGAMLVSLAWVFDQRGDQEMARHLLDESQSRMPRSPLPTALPALHAWAEERRAAWGLRT